MAAEGDRVEVANRGFGVVRFVGETQFAPGVTWIGVELDAATGKNDGSVNDVRYFDCATNHGCFVKEDAISKLPPRRSNSSTPPLPSEERASSSTLPAVDTSSRRLSSGTRTVSPASTISRGKSPRVSLGGASTSGVSLPGGISPSSSSAGVGASSAGASAASSVRPGLSKIQAAREKKRLLAQRIQRNAAAPKGPEQGTGDAEDSRSAPTRTPPLSPPEASSNKLLHVSSEVSAAGVLGKDLSVLEAQVSEYTERIKTLEDKLRESQQNAESLQSQLQSELASLREELEQRTDEQAKADASLSSEKSHRVELEATVRTLTSQLERAEMDVEAKSKASSAKQDRMLEKQTKEIEELNALIETLSLDKEQLEMDKDIAEEKATELELELEQMKLDVEEERLQLAEERDALAMAAATAAAANVPEGAEEIAAKLSRVTEENGKLRDALKRLHTASTAEKSEAAREIRSLTKERDSLAQSSAQLESATQAKKRLEEEVEELKIMLDTAQAYESMVENLSEKNLELADENAALKEANEELEELRLLSEEVEQQHADLQQQLERDMENNRTEMINAQLESETLRRELLSMEESMEKLRSVVVEGHKREGGLREELSSIESLQRQLQQAKENARTANLALLSETESKLAQTIEMHAGLAEARRSSFQASCMGALVPGNIMANGNLVLESLSRSMQVVDATSLVVSLVIRAGAAKLTTWDEDIAPKSTQNLVHVLLAVHSCASHLWKISRTPGATFEAFEAVASDLTSVLQQMSQGVQQLLSIVRRGDRGIGQLAAEEDANQVNVVERLMRSSCATYEALAQKLVDASGHVIESYAAGPYQLLRMLQMKYLTEERSEEDAPASDSVVFDIMSCAASLEFSPALVLQDSIQTDESNSLRELCEAEGPKDDDLIRSVLGPLRVSLEESIQNFDEEGGDLSSKLTPPPLWTEHAAAIEEILNQAASTRSELDNVKSALKRRVLEVHTKTGEVQALQAVRTEIEEKLAAARAALKDQDALQAQCASLEAQVQAKTLEVEQALAVAREQAIQEAAQGQTNVSTSAAPREVTPTSSPVKSTPLTLAQVAAAAGLSSSSSMRATTSTPSGETNSPGDVSVSEIEVADPALLQTLQDEVSFWRGRAVESKLAKLQPLHFAPRHRYQGGMLPRISKSSDFHTGEDTLTRKRASALEREALLAQASLRIPDISRVPETSIRQQVLDSQLRARTLARKLNALHLTRTVAPAKAAGEHMNARPRQVGRLTISANEGSSSTNDAPSTSISPAPVKLLLSAQQLDSLFGRIPLAAA